MPTERRIRADHPNYELRHARVRVARKVYDCALCQTLYVDATGHQFKWPTTVAPHSTYARISETRLPVCGAHFTEDDIVEVRK